MNEMGARARDREIDQLFELSPEEFTAARDRLAKELKAGGDDEGAAGVKALRRPTLPAWAVNQVVRRDRAGTDALLRAGDELRKIQRRALSGVSGGGLREAAEHRRRAVRALLKEAEDLLGEVGRATASTMEAIQATFEAASTDEEAGRLLQEARLSKEFPPPAGFGTVEGLSLVPVPSEPRRSSKQPAAGAAKRAGGKAEKERDASRIAELRGERDEAQRQARELQREADAARKEAQRASRAAVKAEEEAERAQQAAEEATQAARKLASTARQAGSEASRAEREAERAARALEQAKERLAEAQG
jgi:hypothetical protein